MLYWVGRALQVAGMIAVLNVLILNGWGEGVTMASMLRLTAFGILLFAIGTTLLRFKD